MFVGKTIKRIKMGDRYERISNLYIEFETGETLEVNGNNDRGEGAISADIFDKNGVLMDIFE